MQMVFQDPVSSLNPRRRARDIVAEPLDIWRRGRRAERADAAAAMLEAVGLDPSVAGDRRPGEFSGGQCQRISIARALVLEPKLLVCDEIVSSLDVSVQAQILNLLDDLKARYGLSVLFIAHDLAVVKNVSDRVAVMYLGRLCEVAPADTLYRRPAHPYTAALLGSAVDPDPDRAAGEAVGRRAAEPDRPTVGLPVPHPLSAGRGSLRGRGTGAAGGGPGSDGRLPLPARRAGGSARPRPADYPLGAGLYDLAPGALRSTGSATGSG